VIPNQIYEEKWLQLCQKMHREVETVNHNFFRVQLIEDNIEKSDIINEILRSLSQWFGIEKAIQEYVDGVKDCTFITMNINRIPIGFIALTSHNKYTSEIYVMGIYQEFHRYGFGKQLVTRAIQMLQAEGKKFLTVKTLSATHPDPNYRKTREFYRAMGFYPLEEFSELWGKENPCLFMVKKLDE